MTEDNEAQLQVRLARAAANNRICSQLRAALRVAEGVARSTVTITRYTSDGHPGQITVRYAGAATPGQLFDALNNARLRPAGCDLVCVPEDTPTITAISLDVDEVLADWVTPTLGLLGYDSAEVFRRWDAMHPRPWDLFEVIGRNPHEAWARIDDAGADFWANLRLFTWAADLLDVCHGFAPTILVTSPSLHESSHSGKRLWMQRHFGHYFRDYLIGPPKAHCAHPGALLIDDSPKNCEAFRKRGVHAILFPGVGNDLHHIAPDQRVPYVVEQLKGYRKA